MKALIAILVAAVTVDIRMASAQSVGEELAPSERAFIVSKIYASLEIYFTHRTGVADLDPETAYKGYLERAFAATNRRDFDLATLEFMAGFRNKHTQFDDQWLRRRFGESLGFVASQVDGKWLITRTEVTSVRKGDIIRMIEGMAVEAFVRD